MIHGIDGSNSNRPWTLRAGYLNIMANKQTYSQWIADIEVLIKHSTCQVRLHPTFYKSLFDEGHRSLEVFKMIEEVSILYGLIDDGRPVPYDSGLSKPKGAKVVKVLYFTGDWVPPGIKGIIKGGKIIRGKEWYLVQWETMKEKLNVVSGESIKVLKR